MLLTTILLWALNLSVTKVILTHGLHPLSYAIARFGLAGAIFAGITLLLERTLAVERRHLPLLALAIAALVANQLSFVFALDLTTASTVGLLLGAIPTFAGLFGVSLGLGHPSARFWLGAAVSGVGVSLVAIGASGEVSGSPVGVLLGLSTAATWALYSVAAAPLMRTYSPYRISALALPGAWLLIAIVGLPASRVQDWTLEPAIWALVLFATLGPLVLTNVLWFRSIHRIGPARAALAVNMQPFVAALLAVLLLAEPLSWLQVLGGALIAAGILLARRRASAAQAT
jgi:drug/metabolite transporter (DMT)-like permease